MVGADRSKLHPCKYVSGRADLCANTRVRYVPRVQTIERVVMRPRRSSFGGMWVAVCERNGKHVCAYWDETDLDEFGELLCHEAHGEGGREDA